MAMRTDVGREFWNVWRDIRLTLVFGAPVGLIYYFSGAYNSAAVDVAADRSELIIEGAILLASPFFGLQLAGLLLRALLYLVMTHLSAQGKPQQHEPQQVIIAPYSVLVATTSLIYGMSFMPAGLLIYLTTGRAIGTAVSLLGVMLFFGWLMWLVTPVHVTGQRDNRPRIEAETQRVRAVATAIENGLPAVGYSTAA